MSRSTFEFSLSEREAHSLCSPPLYFLDRTSTSSRAFDRMRRPRSATVIPEPFSQQPVQHLCIEGQPRKIRFSNPLGLPAPLTWHQVSRTLLAHLHLLELYLVAPSRPQRVERRTEVECSMTSKRDELIGLFLAVLLHLCHSRSRSSMYRWRCKFWDRVSLILLSFSPTPSRKSPSHANRY